MPAVAHTRTRIPAMRHLPGMGTCPGVVVFHHEAGERVRKGDLMVELVDPIANTRTALHAGVDGVFYAHIRDRYVTTGCELGKIAGSIPFRTGDLLGN